MSHAPTGEITVADEVHRRRWAALAVLCLSLVLIVMDNTILNVALPTLSRELKATNSQLQWIVDSYTLVFAGLLLTFGALGDRLGRKKALIGGLSIFGLGSFAATLAGTATQLIAARAFMGIGGAFIMPATLSILANVFRDPRERAKAIGIWSAMSGIGVVIGPLAGGWLLEHFRWPSVFWVNVPLIVVAVGLAARIVPETRDPGVARLDWAGALLSIAGMVSLLWAIIEAPERGWRSGPIVSALVTAVVLLTLFISWELRAAHPMLDVRFFRNPRFSAANGAVTLTFFGMFGSLFLLTQYLQFVQGYGTLAAGIRVAPFALGMGIAAPQAPKLVHRFGTKLVVAAGLSLVGVGLLMMSTIQVSSGYGLVFASMLVMALGMGLTMAPATESVMGSLPPEQAGVGSAVNDTTRELGGALGVAIIGSVVSGQYTAGLGTRLGAVGDQLPAAAVKAMDRSLGAALQVAAQAAKQGQPAVAEAISSAAKEAFVHALSRGLLVGVGTTVLGIICALMFLPARAHDHVEDEVHGETPAADRVLDRDLHRRSADDRTPTQPIDQTEGDELAVVGR